MLWWQNIPFLSIMLCLFSSAVCSVLSGKTSRILTLSVLGTCLAGGVSLLLLLRFSHFPAFTFTMGHFPAPWGNEIRAGELEAVLASLFSLVMLCSLIAGSDDLLRNPVQNRVSLYHTLCLLLMSALLSQVYSNDLFSSYVFLEIMTISSCALIIAKDSGKSLAAGMRYMVLNLVGSGFFLLGIVILYDLTGHLLMVPLQKQVQTLFVSGNHHRALTIVLALMTIGLCIKSALFPFHSWVPDAYSAGFPSSNAILSSIVSKAYIVLLLKVYIRVFGWNLVMASRVDHLILVCAWAGMIIGSLQALQSDTLTRMIAWSSVAQIGYIYMGIGLGANDGGYAAALFHLVVHSLSKSLLFLSGAWLIRSARSDRLSNLKGIARKEQAAGICWTVGACSMIGLPFTGGLVSKMLLGEAALNHSLPIAVISLLIIALSTFLNVLYFLRTALSFWAPGSGCSASLLPSAKPSHMVTCCFLACLILVSFFLATPLLSTLNQGLAQF